MYAASLFESWFNAVVASNCKWTEHRQSLSFFFIWVAFLIWGFNLVLLYFNVTKKRAAFYPSSNKRARFHLLYNLSYPHFVVHKKSWIESNRELSELLRPGQEGFSSSRFLSLTCPVGEGAEAAAAEGTEEPQASRDHRQTEETAGADRKWEAGFQWRRPGGRL